MNKKDTVFACLLIAVLTVLPMAYGCSGAKTSSASDTATLPPPVTTPLTTAPVPTTGLPVTSGVFTTAPPPATVTATTTSTATTPPTPTTTPAGTGLRAVVTVSGEAFLPGVLNVTAGTTVTWINKDTEDHTVTSGTPGLFSGPLPGDPGQFSFLFTKPGSYPYYCAIHTNMMGTIIVS